MGCKSECPEKYRHLSLSPVFHNCDATGKPGRPHTAHHCIGCGARWDENILARRKWLRADQFVT
jgi:hypothetical protein